LTNETQELRPKLHICPVCKTRHEYYAVGELNPNAPCSEKCRQIQLKNESRK